MTNSGTTRQIESLAAEIGDNVYIDVAKWHLYLSDAKLHTIVAQKVYPLLEENELSETAVTDVLKEIPVKLGGGLRELPLSDLIPTQCQADLLSLLENFADN